MSHLPALGELLKRLEARGQDLSSVAELVAGAEPANPGVSDWIEGVRPRLGLFVRALKVIRDPSVICFGGEAPAVLRRGLIDAVQANLRATKTPDPILVESATAGDAAQLGADFLPLHALVFG